MLEILEILEVLDTLELELELNYSDNNIYLATTRVISITILSSIILLLLTVL